MMTTPLEALGNMVAYIRKVGGYMTAEDQIKLRDAEQVLRNTCPCGCCVPPASCSTMRDRRAEPVKAAPCGCVEEVGVTCFHGWRRGSVQP